MCKFAGCGVKNGRGKWKFPPDRKTETVWVKGAVHCTRAPKTSANRRNAKSNPAAAAAAEISSSPANLP